MTNADRESLDRLLSEWLDEPDNAELARRVESAVGNDADRIALRDQWRRLHAALCAEPAVDWVRQRERIMAHLPAAPRRAAEIEARLDELLGEDSEPLAVDWAKMKTRVLDRLDSRRAGPVVVRFPAWRRRWVGLGLAAAAALAIWMAPWGLLLHGTRSGAEPSLPASVATLRIHAAAMTDEKSDAGSSMVQIRVAALPGADVVHPQDEPAAAEDWLMIDPPAVARVSAGEEYGMF